MGNQSINCNRSTPKRCDIVDRQMSMYRWRAQSLSFCVPVIEIKNGSSYRQEMKLNEFVQKCRQKDYLSVSRLRQDIEKLQQSGEEIISFQKYACSLDELQHCLDLEEIILVFDSLLSAFEHIKKKFTTIPINSSCCFVTLNGQVRGWINADPKSNRVDQNCVQKLFGEREYREIILEIIELVSETAFRQNKIQVFLNHLRQYCQSIVVRRDIFDEVGIKIERYCRDFNIKRANNLRALRRKKTLSSLKINCKNSTKKSISMQSSTINEQRSDPQTRSYRSSIQKISNGNVLGITSAFASFGNIHQLPRMSSGHQDINSTRPSLPISQKQVPSTARSFESQKHHFFRRPSQEIPVTPKPLIYSQKSQSKDKTIILASVENIFEVSNTDESATLLQGKFLTSKELSNIQSNSVSNRKHKRWHSGVHQQRLTRNISILDICEQEETFKQNKGPRVHFHTSRQVSSSDNLVDPNRTWITSKTIDRLINHSNVGDSLVHSIGTTSEDCIRSDYSGALSSMGREVSMLKRSGVGSGECEI